MRLKLNQITPDNFDRKVDELREMLIGDRKLLNEDGFDHAEAEGFQISEENLHYFTYLQFTVYSDRFSHSLFICCCCSKKCPLTSIIGIRVTLTSHTSQLGQNSIVILSREKYYHLE